MPTDRLARGPLGAGIAWQAHHPNCIRSLRQCARRGALASQSSTFKTRVPSDR